MFTCIQKCWYPTFTSFLLGIFLEINHPAIIRGSPMTFCGPHMGLSARFRGFAQVKVQWTKNCPLRPDWTATWGQAVGLLARDSRHIFFGETRGNRTYRWCCFGCQPRLAFAKPGDAGYEWLWRSGNLPGKMELLWCPRAPPAKATVYTTHGDFSWVTVDSSGGSENPEEWPWHIVTLLKVGGCVADSCSILVNK